jgi:hypothetical protein
MEAVMVYDPVMAAADAPLSVSDATIRELTALRAAEKSPEVSGVNTAAERQRLASLFDEILDKLIGGLLSNPGRRWVMTQIHPALLAVTFENLETREHCRVLVEKMLAIVGLDESDGILNFYLGGAYRPSEE